MYLVCSGAVVTRFIDALERAAGRGARVCVLFVFFFSSRRRHTRCLSDWSSDVCSSDLGADRDRADRTRRHAPPLIALGARVRRVRGMSLEGRDADHGLGGLVVAGLHVRARELTAQTARALLRMDLENPQRFFLSPRRRAVPRSSRPMNSSSGIAAIVMPATPPRAPSSTDTREIVALSGASMMVTKSYGPNTAYWATTRAPMRCTSALTFRIQPGRPRRTLRPDSDSVLSMTYVATMASSAVHAGPAYQTGDSPLDALRNI